jgi:hypothetical protein
MGGGVGTARGICLCGDDGGLCTDRAGAVDVQSRVTRDNLGPARLIDMARRLGSANCLIFQQEGLLGASF